MSRLNRGSRAALAASLVFGGSLIAVAGTATPVSAAPPTTWTQQSPATSPPARSAASMAYDAGTGQLVLFGGAGDAGALSDTWTWDGTTWTQQSPATSPPARSAASMAYDAGTGQLVLFGGAGDAGALSDTWTWDGTTWTQQSPATSPPARSAASMAYDAGTGQLVLFGGAGDAGALSDTWTWDGTTWTQQSPATSPPARSAASMAYDAGTGQLVLFGGAGDAGALSDTWTWDGTTWTQQSPATSPPARSAASMAYDAGTGQLVLFGGAGDAGALSDTWTWDGTTWTQQSPATSPPARSAASMAYDAGTGQLVLFGGDGDAGALSDTWTFGTPGTVPNWFAPPATNAPGGEGASMAYDPGTGQLVLFGGGDGDPYGSGVLGNTWTYNGTTWTEQSPATSPPARAYGSMAYDAATGQLVLFGGTSAVNYPSSDLADTWTWDGITWTQQSPATSPSARAYGSMAYDAGTGQLVLFGGYTNSGFSNDTWTWDGTTWTQLSPATSPPVRAYGSMAYDAGTGQLVLFGGIHAFINYLSDTWTWDGTTWTQLFPATSPPARNAASMAYDASTGELVLFGGYYETDGGESYLGDTWSWNGSNWMQPSPVTSPSGRDGASMAFDPGTGQMVLVDGGSKNAVLGDTWTYIPQIPQSLSFTSTAPSDAVVGGPTYTVTTTSGGGSGNAVTVTIDVSSTSVCSLSGSTVSFTGTGTCTIDGNQAGNGTYSPAPQAQQSFSVGYNPAYAPTLKSFKPANGKVGKKVTIKGTHLAGETQVSFNGTPATVIRKDTATEIITKVPAGATTGKISVTTTRGGTATSTTNFTVT